MSRFYLKVGLSGKDKHLLATNQLDNSSEALLSWAAKQTFASPLTNKQWADDVLLKHFYFDPLFVKNPRRNDACPAIDLSGRWHFTNIPSITHPVIAVSKRIYSTLNSLLNTLSFPSQG